MMNNIRAVLFDYGGVLAEEGFINVLSELAKEQNLAVNDVTQEGMQAIAQKLELLKGNGGPMPY